MLWGIVQLTQCRMASSGIIPCIGALQSHSVKSLKDFDREIGLKFLEKHPKRCTHDPCTNKHHIGFF